MDASNKRLCFLLRHLRDESDWIEQAAADRIEEQDATIARLHDLVAKFQRGGTSTLYAEGHME
jgi:hypothetical protein